jgi:DNA-binding Lrp family transcriptional regulator
MSATIQLDDFDLRLLGAMERDASLTNQQLGEIVHLSASQVSRRRQRLEEEGVLRRIRAELDAEKLGLGLIVFIRVTLATHTRDNDSRFADLIARTAQIQEAYMMTGDADYLLKVLARDLSHLQRLVAEVLLPHPSIARVSSSIVLSRLKEGGGVLAASRE